MRKIVAIASVFLFLAGVTSVVRAETDIKIPNFHGCTDTKPVLGAKGNVLYYNSDCSGTNLNNNGNTGSLQTILEGAVLSKELNRPEVALNTNDIGRLRIEVAEQRERIAEEEAENASD